MPSRKGFTLIELLVVIAIIAILAVVVVLTLNPAEMLAEARDSNRISDLTTMKQAIELYLADTSDPGAGPSGGGWGVDGGNQFYITLATDTIAQPMFNLNFNTNSCSWPGTWGIPDSADYSSCFSSDDGDGTSCVYYWPQALYADVYTVIPASTTAQAQAIDGTGWVPIDFAAMDTGSPISSEPLDPVNQPGTSACTGSSPSLSSCGLFYSFTSGGGDNNPSFAGTQFQLTAFMESTKYSHGGSNDVETNSMISSFASSTCVDPYEYYAGTATFTNDAFWGW